MKIASIVGARPQFIKLAPLSKEIRKFFKEIVIHTGQHYDYEMNKQFFDELNIPEPDYNLGVGSGTHAEQTGKMMMGIEKILQKEEPELVVVFGDTNSTLAGALASVKLHIPVAHVEAGLRCFDKKVPEEINRILTDHCSDFLFCPTKTAVDNLKREGIKENIHLVGDIMVDTLKQNLKIAEQKSRILDKLKLEPEEYFLATIHRAENTDNYENLKNITEAFCEIKKIVLPLHPRTEKKLKEYKLFEKLCRNIKIIPPVSYLDMLILEKNAKKILTDSGGIQKEAYILKVPCITLRETTEWVETVEDGWNILVGTLKEKIIKNVNEFMPNIEDHKTRFGEGKTSERITKIIGELR
ncbi:MAG: non-hydrolyzing UDP-N-acetylglucosamine 2-epimerase [Promethearchaeota archaeon]